MEEEKTPQELDQEAKARGQQLYNYTVNMLANKTMTAPQVREKLVSDGLDEGQADILIVTVEGQIRDAYRAKGRKNMLYGGLWAVGGTVVTVATFSAASGGGRYVVAWGAIVFGLIQFFQGLAQANKQ